MKHEAIHALATQIRLGASIVAYASEEEARLNLADELDKIAHEYHTEAVHRNEMMFS